MAVVNLYAGPVMTNVLHRHTHLAERNVLLDHHIELWRSGGLDAIVLPISSMDGLKVVLSEIARSEGALKLAAGRADLGNGGFGIFPSAERGLLGEDPDRLYLLAELGVRQFTFSHNRQNPFCTGCGELYEGGFTHLGRETLKVLEGLPIVPDLVHTSRSSFWDALERYPGTVMVSHSCADTIRQHPRNLTDDQIRAVAEGGGVVGVNFYRGYVHEDPKAATLDHLVDHVAHMCELVGARHVACGADFLEASPELVAPALAHVDPEGEHGLDIADYIDGPMGIENNSKFSAVGEALAARGFSEEDVALVMGESYLDVLDRVQADS